MCPLIIRRAGITALEYAREHGAQHFYALELERESVFGAVRVEVASRRAGTFRAVLSMPAGLA